MSTLPDSISFAGAGDHLLAGFREFIGDAEKLLRATAEYSGESIAGARTQLQGRLEQVRTAVTDAEAAALAQGRDAVRGAGRLVRDNPWSAAAIALGLVVAIGLLGSRR